jgi:uncharacterized protein
VSAYLDASVIVPTLVDEASSMTVARFLATATERLIVSDFAAAEVASALSRLVRMALLTSAHASARLREFDVWRASATDPIDFQPSDFRLANIFVRNLDLGLRAPDAVHAAVCRRGGLTLVTLDRRLAAAAEALDVHVAIP